MPDVSLETCPLNRCCQVARIQGRCEDAVGQLWPEWGCTGTYEIRTGLETIFFGPDSYDDWLADVALACNRVLRFSTSGFRVDGCTNEGAANTLIQKRGSAGKKEILIVSTTLSMEMGI